LSANPPQEAGPRDFLLDMLPKDSVGVEIGVHLGDFSQRILERVNPRQLNLVDPWRHETAETYRNAWYGGRVENGQAGMDSRYNLVLERFQVPIRDGRVVVHRGPSADMLARFPAESVDWTYIDGNHLYEYVMGDLESSLRVVRSGGYITGDDYVDGGWWQGGVRRAVDDFAVSAKVRLLLIRDRQFIFQKL
jgi:hypothetical protein